ncbi:hypothetical protein AB2B41_06090 [Marimonas sp. MJW-29]|uniref:Lipoprotein n=1 Tax=Sulfitobacter sediminis TaxID=3234186 RepID=A0ABV3RJL3_9RHOB
MKTSLLVCAAVLVLLAGCTDSKNRIAFDGQYFRAKASKVDNTRHAFTVRVRDVSRSLDGAIAAGRHEGISYCVNNFGSSDIEWTVGPDTPPEQLQITDNTLVFQGVCPHR